MFHQGQHETNQSTLYAVVVLAQDTDVWKKMNQSYCQFSPNYNEFIAGEGGAIRRSRSSERGADQDMMMGWKEMNWEHDTSLMSQRREDGRH